MTELEGKVALVTGGAQGLGAAICQVFLREGAKVVLTDADVERARTKARQLGTGVRATKLDVTVADEWKRAGEFATTVFGPLDILVNNAGLMGSFAFEDTPPERWDRLIGVMQTGPYLGMRTVLPDFARRRAGSIVNITSANAIRGRINAGAYTSAKHGLLGLTRSLALEYAPRGIRINAVCPGAMSTPMLVDAFGDEIDVYASTIPIQRIADASEVAEVVSFLASDRASYCVGEAIVVDGGITGGMFGDRVTSSSF